MVEPVFSPELPRFEIDEERRLVYYIMPNGRTEVRHLADFRIVTQMAVDALAELDARTFPREEDRPFATH